MRDINTLRISSTSPCFIVYLLDQSGSMSEPFGNAAHSKAVELANSINETIYEIGGRCWDNGEIRNRFEVAVIGYGQDGQHAQSSWEGNLKGKWAIPISEIFKNPLGIANEIPYWINPYAQQATPMTNAFENARRICNDWIHWGNHMDCSPPIIINITDGLPTDSGPGNRRLLSEIERIKTLSTNYGNVLILNIHISDHANDKLLFPADIPQQLNPTAHLLYTMSSPLTPNMIQKARSVGYEIETGAKGYVFNGNVVDLFNFLEIGSNPV